MTTKTTRKKLTIPKVAKAAPATVAKKGPVVLTGHERVVDEIARLRTVKLDQELLEKGLRTQLDPVVAAFRDTLEASGVFTKSLQIKGTDANGVYTFPDRYARIDPIVEPKLRELLGTFYDQLFEHASDVVVKEPARFLALLDDLRQKGAVNGPMTADFIRGLVDVQSYIAPVPEFRRCRFELRGKLTEAQNVALDLVVTQVGGPSLSFK